MLKYGLPDFIRALSNFDGIFYIRIALNGYSTTEQAYFPLYPLLIRYLNLIIHNPIIAGVVISYGAFFLGLIFFSKYLNFVGDKKNKFWVILFLLAYPTSYYFGVMYTESLFFLLFISSLFFAKKGKLLPAAVLGYLVALTRVVGVFITVPLVFSLLGNLWKHKPKSLADFFSRNWQKLLVSLSPVLGLASYLFYLWQTTGDPLYFIHAQEQFGAHRSSSLISPPQVIYRYLKIFATADRNFQYFVAMLEFVFFMFALTMLLFDLRKILRSKKIIWERLGLNLFSLINIVIPSLTGTLTAMPRYTLLSFSIFFVLAEIDNQLIRYFLLGVFVMLHILLFAFFVQGYYVT